MNWCILTFFSLRRKVNTDQWHEIKPDENRLRFELLMKWAVRGFGIKIFYASQKGLSVRHSEGAAENILSEKILL